MPELNLNYAPRPPWLEKNNDNSSFQNLLAATSSAQQGRQLNMQEKQLASNLVSAQQDQQMNELKIAEHLRLRDETLEAELAVQSKAPVIASLMREGKIEEALQEWQALGIENAKVRASKSYATIADDLRFSLQVKENAKLRADNLLSLNKLRQSQIDENNRVSIDPAEAARIQLSIENLVARRRAGQLDEKKFQLSILEKIQEIETAPLLGIKPADQPAERAKRKAELLRQMRVMGITTEFVEPEGLRQGIEGQLGPVQGRSALPVPASGTAPARPSIWVPDFKSGRLIPKE